MKINEMYTYVIEDESNKSDKKVFRALKKLESWFNPQATKEIDDYNRRREILLEQVNLALCTTAMIKEPTNYEESLNCEKKEYQIAWKEAINKELNEVTKGVFGEQLMKKIFQVIDGASRINGFL